jgi:hypothetical protein
LPGGSLVLLGPVYAQLGVLAWPLVLVLGWLGMGLWRDRAHLRVAAQRGAARPCPHVRRRVLRNWSKSEQERTLLKERLDRLERMLLAPPQEAGQKHSAARQPSNAASGYALDQEGRVIARPSAGCAGTSPRASGTVVSVLLSSSPVVTLSWWQRTATEV